MHLRRAAASWTQTVDHDAPHVATQVGIAVEDAGASCEGHDLVDPGIRAHREASRQDEQES
jgi:hypothetical protein